jgi:hypothetical protein
LKTAKKSSDFETENDLKLGKFKKETQLLEVVQATKSENMRLKAKLEVGASAKSAEQRKLEAKLREESVNVENLQRMNHILQDRIKKLEEMEFDTVEDEVGGKAKERIE